MLQHHSFNGDDSRFLARMGPQCSGCSAVNAVDAAVSTMAGGASWKKWVAQKLHEVYPVASFGSALPWVAQSFHAASGILCLAPSYSLKRPAQFSPEQISLQDRWAWDQRRQHLSLRLMQVSKPAGALSRTAGKHRWSHPSAGTAPLLGWYQGRGWTARGR